MACTIESISITAPDKDNAFLTTAKISYSATAYLPNTNNSAESGYGETSYSPITENSKTQTRTASKNQTREQYTYSKLVYNWEFTVNNGIEGNGGSASDSSGIASIRNLAKGAKNTLKGEVTVTCTKTTQKQIQYQSWTETRQKKDNGEWGDWKKSSVDTSDWKNLGFSSSSSGQEGASASTATPIPIWTRPGTFSGYNFTANTIIESPEGLTTQKVSDWINHCNAYAHWFNQNDDDVTNATCQATANGLITAKWYNACINAIPGLTETQKTKYVDDNPSGLKVHGGPTGTIITANIINLLGTLISQGDT